ncbi:MULTISPECIES: DUF4148 domain-containing protein [Paraburkholderia]|uniref:DUF4148 domain-containing protein n=1 Tax=Paraburkholderia TaxID=1822464 RepID=UPI00225BCDFE|nr:MULTISPECIES: DUF4148 domain-containing protein [Paraburkholderia]MCX4164229.1 DUF4148 domain-containing protein [Paraburkholderia megapolitana]
MKPIRYAVLATLVGAMFSFGQAAFAQNVDPGNAAVNTGKTRAEVRAELIRAEADGLLPVSKTDYPPSAQTIARNRTEYQARYMHDNVSTAAK